MIRKDLLETHRVVSLTFALLLHKAVLNSRSVGDLGVLVIRVPSQNLRHHNKWSLIAGIFFFFLVISFLHPSFISTLMLGVVFYLCQWQNLGAISPPPNIPSHIQSSHIHSSLAFPGCSSDCIHPKKTINAVPLHSQVQSSWSLTLP